MTAEKLRQSSYLRFAELSLAVFILVLGASVSFSAEELSPADQEAVDSAGDSLARGGFNWYDEESDSARPIKLSKKPKKPEPEQIVDHGGSSVSAGGAAASFLSWTVIAVILGLILVWILYYFLAQEKSADDDEESLLDDDDRSDRVEALPQEVRTRRGNLLDQARDHYENGDYDRAIVFLYSYQLLALDRAQWIRLIKGKTNRQYLRELVGNDRLADILRRTMHLFEDVYFGHHSLERQQFESTWNEVDMFHHLVTREMK